MSGILPAGNGVHSPLAPPSITHSIPYSLHPVPFLHSPFDVLVAFLASVRTMPTNGTAEEVEDLAYLTRAVVRRLRDVTTDASTTTTTTTTTAPHTLFSVETAARGSELEDLAIRTCNELLLQDGPAQWPELATTSAATAALGAGRAGTTYGVFGGQGVDYFDELCGIHHKYPQVRPFLQAACDALKAEAASKAARKLPFYTGGFDLAAWLSSSPSSASALSSSAAEASSAAADAEPPSAAYLQSAPISMPLVALTQLANYLVFLHRAGEDPTTMRSRFDRLTGHSQGLASAVAVSVSEGLVELEENMLSTVRFLFWLGARCQQVSAGFVANAISPNMLAMLGAESKRRQTRRNKAAKAAGQKVAVAAGESKDDLPTPMLVVSKVPASVLQQSLDEFNASLKLPKELQVRRASSASFCVAPTVCF